MKLLLLIKQNYLCVKKSKDQQVLKVHMKSHTNTKPFTCKIWPKIFSIKLNTFTGTCTGENIQMGTYFKFLCSQCYNGVQLEKGLQTHMETNHQGK